MSSWETEKNPFHRRNSSDELDVFEAAGYFSGHHQNPYRQEHRQKQRHIQKPAGRISLDDAGHHHRPITAVCLAANHKKQEQQQPRSPGSRLASFLNSLFHQTKKKTKPGRPGAAATARTTAVEEEEVRRKRQSSISHFRMISTKTVAKSPTGLDSADDDTPTKSYKNLRQLSDRRDNDSKQTLEEALHAERKTGQWFAGDSREFRKFSEDDDGGDGHGDGDDSSESSSDLFDLPNHELDFYPWGLPVYETTRVHDIKIT